MSCDPAFPSGPSAWEPFIASLQLPVKREERDRGELRSRFYGQAGWGTLGSCLRFSGHNPDPWSLLEARGGAGNVI